MCAVYLSAGTYRRARLTMTWTQRLMTSRVYHAVAVTSRFVRTTSVSPTRGRLSGRRSAWRHRSSPW